MERKDTLIKLGDQIRSMREKQGISQVELADRIGKDKQAVNRIEQGKVNPGYFQLREISEGLDITLSELLDGL